MEHEEGGKEGQKEERPGETKAGRKAHLSHSG